MSTTTTKERPILFSSPMVRALLDGRKTQTRRIVKPMQGEQSGWLTPEMINLVPHGEMSGGGWQMHHPRAGTRYQGVDIGHDSPLGWIRCPFGVPGDRLWVREKWGRDFEISELTSGHRHPEKGRVYYAADDNGFTARPWRPSIHLPRRHCRIVLEVVSVRVERVQAISEVDAVAEGIRSFTKDGTLMKYWPCDPHDGPMKCTWQDLPRTAREAFLTLFYEINGRVSRDQNPWVWVVQFKRMEAS